MAEGKGRVCVTGGTGFLGSWIIKSLLENGYTVNATVRSSSGKKDVSFLTNLPGASEKLKFFNADLSVPESFNEAIEGCVGVFHTATPIDLEVNEPEEIVTQRTIDGALGILKACKNSKTLKRVVYTSSASASVYYQENQEDELDESYWSDVNVLRSLKPFSWSYAVSKTLAEKAVLEFGKEHGLDIVTLIPTFCVGSFICPKLPGSVYSSLSFLFGDIEKNPFGVSSLHLVHVDDVARAHIFLLEHPNPHGRYNCSPFIISTEEVIDIVTLKYPEFQIPKSKVLMGVKDLKLSPLSSKKLKDAGFEFKYSVEDMVVDAIECCKEKNFL